MYLHSANITDEPDEDDDIKAFPPVWASTEAPPTSRPKPPPKTQPPKATAKTSAKKSKFAGEYHWYTPTRCAIRGVSEMGPEEHETLLAVGEREVPFLGFSTVAVSPSHSHPFPDQPDASSFFVNDVYQTAAERDWVAIAGTNGRYVWRSPRNPDAYKHPPNGLEVVEVLGQPAVCQWNRMLYLLDADGWPVGTSIATTWVEISGIELPGPDDPSEWERGWRLERATVPTLASTP